MEKITINNENLIIFYGNKAGYIKENEAVVDPLFQRDELIDYLTKTNSFCIQWKEGIFDALANNSAVNAINLKSCRIYQLNSESDICMKFISFDDLIMRGFGKPNRENYQIVFDGNLDTNDLEDIYGKFNVDLPENYSGHSLSISDIIELYDDQNSSFYYVDSFGFKEIVFDAPVQELSPNESNLEAPSPEISENNSTYEHQNGNNAETPISSQDDQDEEQEIHTFTM